MIRTWNGMKIAKEIRLHGIEIVVYLIDGDASEETVLENIVAVKGQDPIWKLRPPSIPDYWTDMDYDGNHITAHSFSCWKSQIDPLTGKVFSTSYTK